MEANTQIIDLQSLASGDILQLKTYHFQGKNGAKKAYIQANLHGAEIVGNAVIYELIEFFSNLNSEQIEGEIILVPMCNPVGVNQRNLFFSTGRYSPYDGLNWNRIFWDYIHESPDLDTFVKLNINLSKEEIYYNYLTDIINSFSHKIQEVNNSRSLPFSEHLRNILQSLSLNANYVIDIHSSSVSAIDYIYSFDRRQKSTDYFLLEYAILMNKYDGNAFDEAFLNPWLVLEKKLNHEGRNITFDVEAWTLELGSGMRVKEESVKKGVRGIINYLTYKNILKLELIKPQNNTRFVLKNNLKHYYAPQGGIIRNRLKAGTKIQQGDTLYQLLTFEKKERKPIIIDIQSADQGIIYDVSTNDTVNQGEYILGIFPHV
ncbi:succinylglutamate desuccinylase/aspartoacylase family protein [Cyanobacterium sp. Dongsha4]|uniref:succinylglutamate desuccinylase/aspartoacylase family protein n=1 Tax=Cyanobacterium sp. DS4 TaxID=2878255 RepID=UPI002E80F586|nr:succinylglutamate desuccinylase/aspartoacylase family protein [Cyanobacterium sp. Dongsha4]WVL01118.1 succinylglutamate desuccinylase/aspartoacylase family protein [Cyanobacterium sp. Dongsha4]